MDQFESDFGVPTLNAFAGAPQPINPLNEDVVGTFVAMSPRYVLGSPGNWTITSRAPDMGYGTWDSAFGSKFDLKMLERPRGLFGYNEVYVQKAQDLIAEEKGQPIDTSVSNAVEGTLHALNPFSSNHDELIATLKAEDKSFDPTVEWKTWSEKNPEVALYLRERGFDSRAVQGTKNRDAFMFGINLELTKAQDESDIDRFTKAAGRFSRWTNTGANFLTADLLFDPDTTNTAPLAAAGKLFGLAAKGTEAALVARGFQQGSRGLRIVSAAGKVGEFHSALAKANRFKSLGAIALEGGTYGLGLGIQNELHAVEMADILEGEDARAFNWENVGTSGAIGVGFGLGLYLGAHSIGYGLGKAFGATKSISRKMLMEATGIEGEPIAKLGATMEGLAQQHADDVALTNVNHLLADVTSESGQNAQVGWAMNRDIIEASGRTMTEIGDIANRMLNLKAKMGAALPAKMVDEVMTEFLATGKAVALTEAEDLAVRRAMAQEEAMRLRQASPQWRAQQEANFARWQEAADRADALDPNQTLDRAAIDAVLAGTGIRNVKGNYTVGQLREFTKQQMKAIDNMLNTKIAPREAGAAAIQDAAKAEAIRTGGAFDPKTTAGRTMLALEAEYAKPKPSKAKIKELQARIAAAYPKPSVPTPPAIKVASKMTVADKNALFDHAYDTLKETPAEIAEGTGLVAKAFKYTFGSAGLGRLVVSRIGGNVSFFSKVKPIRALYNLLGEVVTTARMGGKGVNWLAAATRPSRDYGIVRTAAKAAFDVVPAGEWEAFEKAVTNHVRLGTKFAESQPFAAEGNRYIKEYTRWIKDQGQRARQAGLLVGRVKEAMVPNRANWDAIDRNFTQAAADVGAHYQQVARDAKGLNPRLLEAMGWLERDAAGALAPKKGSAYEALIAKLKGEAPPATAEAVAKVEKVAAEADAIAPDSKPVRPKKADLPPDMLAEYMKAIESQKIGDKDFWWVVGRDHWNAMRGQDVFDGTARDWVKRVGKAKPSRSLDGKRRISQQAIANSPELQQWYRNDLIGLGYEYARGAAAKIHVQQAVNRFVGAKGLAPYEVLDALEKRTLAEWGNDPAMVDHIKGGFDNAHEKLAELMGGLPNLDSKYTTAANFGFELAAKGTQALFSGTIPVAMLPETTALIFTKLLDVRHLGKNLGDIFRSAWSRRELEGTIFALRNSVASEVGRIHGGMADASFELGTLNRQLKPWKSVVDRTRSPGLSLSQKTQLGILQTVDAYSKSSYSLAGGNLVQNWTWGLAVTQERQNLATTIKAATKLRGLLAEHPITAFQGEGRKQFIGLARKAGFGGNWDIALDWVKHDLMEPGLLEHLQAGLEATGQKRDFDLGKLASWAADQKEVAAREAVARAQMLIENRMAKWSPELSPLIQRTDPSSRTGVGRVANVFTSYPLALYTHKLLNAQGMPGGKIISLLFAGMMGEMLIGKFREMLNGRSGAEIADEIESDPVKALSVYALRVPWLGNLTPWVEAAVTQLVQPERARTPNPLAGPASAALTSIDHGRRMVAGLFQSEQSANANEERALNAIAGMNWMTHGLYNNALASALGLAEEQEKRLNRRWRSTPEPSRQSPGLLFEDSSDPRKEIRLPTMQTAPEFNLNESLDKE